MSSCAETAWGSATDHWEIDDGAAAESAAENGIGTAFALNGDSSSEESTTIYSCVV